MTRQAYTRALRSLYLQLPGTSGRFSRCHRNLAAQLYQRGIPWDTLRAALLLGTARRLSRDPNAPPLPPVRSLHYFLPVIDEIRLAPLSNSYIHYLEHKIGKYKSGEHSPARTTPALNQKSADSDAR